MSTTEVYIYDAQGTLQGVKIVRERLAAGRWSRFGREVRPDLLDVVERTITAGKLSPQKEKQK